MIGTYNIRTLQESEYQQLKDIGDFLYFNHPDKNLTPDATDYILKLLVDFHKEEIKNIDKKLDEAYDAGYEEGHQDGYEKGYADCLDN